MFSSCKSLSEKSRRREKKSKMRAKNRNHSLQYKKKGEMTGSLWDLWHIKGIDNKFDLKEKL